MTIIINKINKNTWTKDDMGCKKEKWTKESVKVRFESKKWLMDNIFRKKKKNNSKKLNIKWLKNGRREGQSVNTR